LQGILKVNFKMKCYRYLEIRVTMQSALTLQDLLWYLPVYRSCGETMGDGEWQLAESDGGNAASATAGRPLLRNGVPAQYGAIP
jgi:hypothetical protein